MNSIITVLVAYNQILLSQIQQLLLFIVKNVHLKSPKHDTTSPKYNKLTVDKLPVIKQPEQLDYKSKRRTASTSTSTNASTRTVYSISIISKSCPRKTMPNIGRTSISLSYTDCVMSRFSYVTLHYPPYFIFVPQFPQKAAIVIIKFCRVLSASI